MSWCHLAQYLSSKVLGFYRLKAPCITLFSDSKWVDLKVNPLRHAPIFGAAAIRTRARARKRARAHVRILY
nr:MAG TPA: hypothetical protein [Microviridae sp.]